VEKRNWIKSAATAGMDPSAKGLKQGILRLVGDGLDKGEVSGGKKPPKRE